MHSVEDSFQGGLLCDVCGSSTLDASPLNKFLPSPADIITLRGPQNPAHQAS
jgi:hypothetical protein